MIKLYTDPEKLLNREEMIFSNYLSITGKSSIPCDRKYFTLAGPCIDDFGRIIPNTELYHLLKKKLIQKEQLISFENKNFDTHNRNSKFKGPIWLKQDICSFDFSLLAKNQLPAIINFDSCDYFPNGLKGLKRIIASIDACNIRDILIVFNSILDYSNRLTPISIEEAKKCFNFKHWRMTKYATYRGRFSKTTMGTFSFYKK